MKTLSTIKHLAITALLLFAASCKKDIHDNGIRLALPKAENFQHLREQALAAITQTTTFDAEDGIEFISEKGAKLSIYGGCLTDLNGNAITGSVTLSYIEIYDRGNMVLTNKPLMGKDDNGNLLPLITGGEFNIEVWQGNNKLKTNCGYMLDIPADLTGGLDTDMIMWNGIINEEGNLVWEEAATENAEQGGIFANEESNTYNSWSDRFGWTNVDRFYNYNGAKTQIKVHVPSGYDNTNSAVYLAYEDQPGLLAQLDTYNHSEKLFSEHYGFVPVGLKVHVIFTSESNGHITYAIKEITIADNHIIQINNSDISITTPENLIDIINDFN